MRSGNGKDSHNGVVRGICLHCHWEVQRPVIEDRCCVESRFQVLEGIGLWFSKMPGSILPAEISEGLGEFCVTTDEVSIECAESYDGLELVAIMVYRPCFAHR